MLDTITGSPITHFAGRAVSSGRVQPHASGSSRRGPLSLPMQPIAQFFDALRGKRTYLVCGIALAYLFICQFAGRHPDDNILGILAALGVASLRAGIASAARPVLGLLVTLVAFSLLCTGCITSPSKVVRKDVEVRFGTNVFRISNPQDTSIDDLMISHDGVVRIKKYRSAANEGAIVASEKQAEFQGRLMELLLNRVDQRIDQVGVPLARSYGIPVQPLEPLQPIPRATVATNIPTAK